jgi:hypothetical protein
MRMVAGTWFDLDGDMTQSRVSSIQRHILWLPEILQQSRRG